MAVDRSVGRGGELKERRCCDSEEGGGLRSQAALPVSLRPRSQSGSGRAPS